MNFQISSEKIGNPLLIELLKTLVDCFDTIGLPFYVIGATARDIIIRQLIDTASQRRTQDLDIAIAIPDWDKFYEVSKTLIAAGLKKSLHQHQRFYMGDYALDIVPLLNAEQRGYYGTAIQQEIDKGEASKLINQIIEHHPSLSYDLVSKTWQEMANIFILYKKIVVITE
jgi:hypothetical protein